MFLRKGQKFKDKTSFFTLNLFNGPTTLNLVRDNKHGRITKTSCSNWPTAHVRVNLLVPSPSEQVS